MCARASPGDLSLQTSSPLYHHCHQHLCFGLELSLRPSSGRVLMWAPLAHRWDRSRTVKRGPCAKVKWPRSEHAILRWAIGASPWRRCAVNWFPPSAFQHQVSQCVHHLRCQISYAWPVRFAWAYDRKLARNPAAGSDGRGRKLYVAVVLYPQAMGVLPHVPRAQLRQWAWVRLVVFRRVTLRLRVAAFKRFSV